MTLVYGAPSVFWTLTPNPDSSITTAFWTSQNLPNGRPQELRLCCIDNMPTSSIMAKMVAANATVQAHFYNLCCQILVETIFGWDISAKKPKKTRGIFGHVEALFYALEQQGRLRIHHHGVAWIAGLPKTKHDWENILSDERTKTKFEAYCTSLFAAEFPMYRNLTSVDCPNEKCTATLKPTEIPSKYKYLLKSSVPPPHVAECINCKQTFTNDEVVSSVVESKWTALSTENQIASTDEAVRAIRLRLGGISADKQTADVQLTRLLMKDQVHAYDHTRSCIKSSVSSKCRYHFFRDLVDSSGFGDNDEIVYERKIGNQWLNTYVPIWRRIFHFNMDARILWSGGGLQAARYAIQYAAKRQSVLDNVAVVELAFRKRVERENGSNKTNTSVPTAPKSQGMEQQLQDKKNTIPLCRLTELTQAQWQDLAEQRRSMNLRRPRQTDDSYNNSSTKKRVRLSGNRTTEFVTYFS